MACLRRSVPIAESRKSRYLLFSQTCYTLLGVASSNLILLKPQLKIVLNSWSLKVFNNCSILITIYGYRNNSFVFEEVWSNKRHWFIGHGNTAPYSNFRWWIVFVFQMTQIQQFCFFAIPLCRIWALSLIRFCSVAYYWKRTWFWWTKFSHRSQKIRKWND